MEIRIGVAEAPREVVLESDESVDSVRAAIEKAISAGSMLELVDNRGRTVLVPGGKVAYVEIGSPAAGRVGFGG